MSSLTECLGVFCWCLPWFSLPAEYEDREPLLPQYQDETVLQRELHQKLHTYQMLRALGQGYMPSNEQAIINLRTLLTADVLQVDDADLSDSGRALVHYLKLWLNQLMDLLQHKNAHDQIQDFVWYMTKARVSVDVQDVAHRTSKVLSKAETAATYQKLRTVGSLLLSNSDFRIFLSDLSTIGREVFRDTANTLSHVSKQAARRIEPSEQEQEALKEPGADGESAPKPEELGGDVKDVVQVVAEGAAEVAQEAEHSFVEKIKGDESATLLYRLREAVGKLRQRPDYSESVHTLSTLLQRYLFVPSEVIHETVAAAKHDVHTNAETDRAVENFWIFVKSFGNPAEWQELEKRFGRVLEHSKADPKFAELLKQSANALDDMLLDPDFFEGAEQRFQQLRAKSKEFTSDLSVREDLDGFLTKLQTTIKSILRDDDIANLTTTTGHIAKILSPTHQYTNTELVTDAVHFFVPKIIESIQYVPIPRIEVSTPEVDLLLENLILEPGITVNNTSFLPYRLRVETRNDIEIRKARTRTTSSIESVVTVKLHGMSIRAEEIGYWIRAHSGMLQLADEGIASFELDERGVDIELDIEVAKERMESILSLKDVRVHIHKLDYTLRKSKFALAASVFKPMLVPILRKAIEVQMSTAIGDMIHFANRELLYARERLRATRIANPDDLWTFIKAVSARLVPEEDPDLYTRVGVAEPGRGVFKGVYAPGSIAKIWEEQAAQAKQRIRERQADGWRNEIFDVVTTQY
ncbi:hypothetical protein BD289DRAFT_482972 [Coniella lustricola]|uniref:Bactericidal permeability-increasing protein n=1 Tax=Coniella lustricola TaxID=2025994 RepID=A0A2T3A747_9PEZI|nr:hypothetical protein BD289DRAFT_482972 [Coniella lustricola]